MSNQWAASALAEPQGELLVLNFDGSVFRLTKSQVTPLFQVPGILLTSWLTRWAALPTAKSPCCASAKTSTLLGGQPWRIGQANRRWRSPRGAAP
jgi:hypothetical protein